MRGETGEQTVTLKCVKAQGSLGEAPSVCVKAEKGRLQVRGDGLARSWRKKSSKAS